MNIIAKLAPFKAFRYVAYLVAFFMWMMAAVCDSCAAVRRECRASWADLCLVIEGNEQSWARSKLK